MNVIQISILFNSSTTIYLSFSSPVYASALQRKLSPRAAAAAIAVVFVATATIDAYNTATDVVAATSAHYEIVQKS